MAISISELHERAVVLEQKEHADAEISKLGNLRAGNSGVLLPSGATSGSCHRITYLRMLGVAVEETSADRLIMFAAGNANEEYWTKKLTPTWPGKILRESEIPTSWLTSGGKKVTGRPDIVLCDDAGKPQYGLELKMVASVWTARTVAFEGQPKMGHIAQATHYMWQLGVPFKIVYTSYVDFAIPSWANKMFGGKPELVERNDKGDIKKVLPFYVVYDLRLDSRGVCQVAMEGTNNWKDTIVTVDGIRGYYESVAAIETTKNLLGRPETLDVFGEKENYHSCQYCPLSDICDLADEGKHDAWLEAVRKRAPSVLTSN